LRLQASLEATPYALVSSSASSIVSSINKHQTTSPNAFSNRYCTVLLSGHVMRCRMKRGLFNGSEDYRDTPRRFEI